MGGMFSDRLAEGLAVPVEGWDFSWFDGRATEERPSWGYSRLLADRAASAKALLDVQTGGGEVLAAVPVLPPVVAATESWEPNLALARRRLGDVVAHVADDADLPFPDGHFDLVVSRHPVATRWDEVARVLAPGGRYLAQHVGSGTVRELTEFMMGPVTGGRREGDPRTTRSGVDVVTLVTAAERAGLDVVDVRHEALRMEFFDVAAVVVFLRKVVWTVPGFTVDAYRDRLETLHDFIERHGPFVAHSQRILIEAVR
ncbi:class I SAM-dependent methyltransferase [Herbidospora cretacea]|uniref:class I SAM-dependent methyltransferase n=1 Tax=Herbidospora cretacea TaxID=28444 RepID=UPI003AFADA9C